MLFRTVRVVLFYGALIGVWQLVAMTHHWPDYKLPPPGGVFESLRKNVENGLIQHALENSLRRLGIGYAIAFVLGLIIGIACGALRWVDETVGSLVLGMQSLPSITWLGPAVLWFGIGDKSIIFVVLMGSLFSIAISARDGVRNIPPLLQRAAQTFGARRLQLYRYVVLPAMLPSMVQGMKLGWSFAWRSLMAGELIVVTIGIGHLLETGRNLNDIDMIFAVMLVIIAVGVTVDRLIFGRVESWVRDRWGLSQA
jgi:NitT/TauT family transport system permease protein